MRTALKLSLILSLLAPSAALAKPRKDSAWLKACIAERMENAKANGASGASTTEARKICQAEQPSKLAQRIERNRARAEKAADRADRVRERCELALYEACVLREIARLGHDQDQTVCEPIRADGKGGETDYSVCRTTATTEDK